MLRKEGLIQEEVELQPLPQQRISDRRAGLRGRAHAENQQISVMRILLQKLQKMTPFSFFFLALQLAIKPALIGRKVLPSQKIK